MGINNSFKMWIGIFDVSIPCYPIGILLYYTFHQLVLGVSWEMLWKIGQMMIVHGTWECAVFPEWGIPKTTGFNTKMIEFRMIWGSVLGKLHMIYFMPKLASCDPYHTNIAAQVLTRICPDIYYDIILTWVREQIWHIYWPDISHQLWHIVWHLVWLIKCDYLWSDKCHLTPIQTYWSNICPGAKFILTYGCVWK